MKCVRCLHDTADVIAKAPDGSGAWVVYLCKHCNYSWCNNEVESITNIEKRDPWAQMDKVDISKIKPVTYTASEEKPENLK